MAKRMKHGIRTSKEPLTFTYTSALLFYLQIEREEDRWYKSIVLVGDKKFSSTEW